MKDVKEERVMGVTNASCSYVKEQCVIKEQCVMKNKCVVTEQCVIKQECEGECVVDA